MKFHFKREVKIHIWPLKVPLSKSHGTKWKPIYGFLYVCNRNEVYIACYFRDICKNSILTSWPWVKVKGHGTNESPYMVFYMSIIKMKSLSVVVFEIFAKIAFWPLDLGPRSKVMAPNESPHMVSYMSVMQMESLTLVIRDIFEKKIRSKWVFGEQGATIHSTRCF